VDYNSLREMFISITRAGYSYADKLSFIFKSNFGFFLLIYVLFLFKTI